MKENQLQKFYWGIGLENETYLEFENPLNVSGLFIQEKIGFEKYSIDYRNCYKKDSLEPVLKKGFDLDKKYTVSRMLNSHSLEKLDHNFNPLPKLEPENDKATDLDSTKSIMNLFLQKQPYNIQSMVTQRNKTMGSVHFDGDSIEFVTKYFENRTIEESCNELNATKKIFIDSFNSATIIPEKVTFPKYNNGLNMFMTNQENLVLFNNGTYHFHITLPTLTENSRIIDYKAFEDTHTNAMYLLQWFEPFFIATLGSPDLMQVISNEYGMGEKFTLGSMRNAMSRYIGVGTYNKEMPKGKILTYNVTEFRKLLKFSKEDNIWWRDQIEADMQYDLLSELGLDFNLEKMYQSGFEFRSFDEFPAQYLNEVLYAIILVCEHSLNLPNVQWGHDSKSWNNLVYRSLKHGYLTKIEPNEKLEILQLLQIIETKSESETYSLGKFETIDRLDEFFFTILETLFDKYKDSNICLDNMSGSIRNTAPTWENFNEFQVHMHLKQIAIN